MCISEKHDGLRASIIFFLHAMRKCYPFTSLGLAATTGLLLACWPLEVMAANPDGALRVEIITAYNLVVDSNAAPRRPMRRNRPTSGRSSAMTGTRR